MEPSRYTDPLEEALSQGSQRVAQLASLAGAMMQVTIQRRTINEALAAQHDERTARALRQVQQALAQRARLAYAPAHDPQWLANATFTQIARAWGGAAVHADTDHAAATALRKCETRLRELHPYAMARYDRLRTDGLAPLDAMRQTAPLFMRPPHVRPGQPVPARPALGASATPDGSIDPAADDAVDLAEDDETDVQAELRGRQIAERLQIHAQSSGRPPLQPDELVMVLEAITNLPEETIAKIAGGPPSSRPDPARTATQIAAESFPAGATDAVTASSTGRTQNPTQRVTLELPVSEAKPSRRAP